MLCAQDAHTFKPFGRQYCTVHPGYSHAERTLPGSDCATISIAPPSVRTLKEDSTGDHPKVNLLLSIILHVIVDLICMFNVRKVLTFKKV